MATPRSTRPITLAGFTVIFMTFGVFGGWATVAKLDSAVIAPGTVALDGNRKVVQHLEGGMVSEILVDEADRVEIGDILVRLTDVEAGSNLEVIANRLAIAEITEARLMAERKMEDRIDLPHKVRGTVREKAVASALEDQRDLFADRRSVRDSQIDILNARMRQTENQIDGLRTQKDALDKRLDNYTVMVERMRGGNASGLVQGNVLSQREDELIQIESDLGGIVSQIAQAENAIGGMELEALQVEQEYRERANTELEDVRAEIAELQEREKVASDVLSRTAIRAPGNGTIQNLKVHTVGEVVQPGEDLMELVPANEKLVINARVAPIDIDNVLPGLVAEVRFSAIKSRLTPIIIGEVKTVSADVITPENPNEEAYYLARIDVSDVDLPAIVEEKLSAGMPAEVIVKSGERRVVDYLASPLMDAVRKSLIEE